MHELHYTYNNKKKCDSYNIQYLNDSWAGQRLVYALSQLPQTNLSSSLNMQFQQQQLREREQKRQALLTNETKLGSGTIGKGKVRQLFEERRRGAGIDRSNPLKPIVTTVTTEKIATKYTVINNNTKCSSSMNSRLRNMNNSNAQKNVVTKTASKAFKDDSYNCDTVDNLNNKIFSNEFAKLSITPNQINGNAIGDRNNNNRQHAHAELIRGDTFDSNRTKIRSHSVQANAFKLNPVVTKKTPNTTTMSTVTTATVKATKNRKSPINTNGTVNGNGINRSTAQSPNIRKMTTNRLSGGGKTTTTTAIKTIGNRSATFNMAAKPPPRITTPPEGMSTCRYCQRHFVNDRLVKHEEVCKKMMNAKRKVFDATIHRIRGTEAEKYMNKNDGRPTVGPSVRYMSAAAATNLKMEPNPAVKKSNWRKKHEEFIRAIREAKKVQAHLARGGKLSDLPPPPPLDTSDYIQCPHCGRRFNQEAAERHIPKCANMRHNKPKPPQSTNKRH